MTSISTAEPTTAPTSDLVATARLFRVLADPTRLMILTLLLAAPRTVSELVAITGAPQSRVSNHLACLRWCRLASAERSGRQMVYRALEESLTGVLAEVAPLVQARREQLASCRRLGPDWLH